MRILVAEDDRANLDLLHAHLSRWDFEVETVADGDQALHSLSVMPGGLALSR
jgi:DNA-binding response OmpR family regulator